jgi:poly-gamma-glutamate synthesis protein (capsule biosynthesis protein)
MGSRLTLFLAGDVMTGRGVDQILAHPGDPRLHERWVDDATTYLELAERVSGPIPRPVGPAYIWGDALGELGRARPDARIVNLETSVTRSDDFWPDKDVHYRMNPANVDCLGAAGIDVAVLANNHVLDWGAAGLVETLDTLDRAGVRTAGAGRRLADASRPVVVELPGDRRLAVAAVGSETSGVPAGWEASPISPTRPPIGCWRAGGSRGSSSSRSTGAATGASTSPRPSSGSRTA